MPSRALHCKVQNCAKSSREGLDIQMKFHTLFARPIDFKWSLNLPLDLQNSAVTWKPEKTQQNQTLLKANKSIMHFCATSNFIVFCMWRAEKRYSHQSRAIKTCINIAAMHCCRQPDEIHEITLIMRLKVRKLYVH